MNKSIVSIIDQDKLNRNLINKSVLMRINRSLSKLSREFYYLDSNFWSHLKEDMGNLIGISNIRIIGIIMSLIIIQKINNNLVHDLGHIMKYCYLNPTSTLSKSAETKMKELSARLRMRLDYSNDINVGSITLLLEQLRQIKSILSLVKTKSMISNMFMSLIDVIYDII